MISRFKSSMPAHIKLAQEELGKDCVAVFIIRLIGRHYKLPIQAVISIQNNAELYTITDVISFEDNGVTKIRVLMTDGGVLDVYVDSVAWISKDTLSLLTM